MSSINYLQDWTPLVLNKPKTKHSSSIKDASSIKEYNNLLNDDYVAKNININISNQIKNARCSKSLTQKQLANRLNVKESVINNYESGKIIPNNHTLNQISKILDIKLSKSS